MLCTCMVLCTCVVADAILHLSMSGLSGLPASDNELATSGNNWRVDFVIQLQD